ncbi:MAG: single-stranded DNA-binding protein, partial [Anaerovoracaceae bacterium]
TRPFKKEETDFINCKAFGKTAEVITQYLTKGSPIAVSGSIQTGSYDAKDGTKRYTTEVVLDGFDFIGSNGKKEDAAQGEEDPFANGETLKDGEMPF